MSNTWERRGLLTRRERLELLLGAPLALVVLFFQVRAVWRSLNGAPLEVLLFAARWEAEPLAFLFVLLLYAASILIILAFLGFQFVQARRWISSRRR